MTPTTTNSAHQSAKALFFSALSECMHNGSHYITKAAIEQIIAAKQISIVHSSIGRYLFEALRKGIINDAGRGWYSSLAVRFSLDTKPVYRIIKQLSAAFPLATFSCWSTAQINAYTQHMLNRFVTFVYVEAELVATFAEFLREAGYRVYADPGKAEIEKTFVIDKDTIVIREAISKQPEGENHAAPIEKLLVDLVWESKKLQFIDEIEAQTICNNAIAAGRVNVAELLGYASRRTLDFAWLKMSNNSKLF